MKNINLKKVLGSLLSIGVVAVVAVLVTNAYFSDTEKSTGNILSAGVIDIVVDDQNPWTKTFTDRLTDMKPSYTRYIVFTVRNLRESNSINLWKHINIVSQTDGVITEPECEEGGGTWTQVVPTGTSQCGGNYIPRNNLAAYIIYDMYVCADPVVDSKCLTDENGKPTGQEWTAIIKEDQFVRLDNVASTWIKLGSLNPEKELKVVQSYHLSTWPDAPEKEVTNWAQGDELTFDIELMAMQLNAPPPQGAQATLDMDNKDPVTWVPNTGDNMKGTLTYNTSGPTFNYSFSGSGLQVNTPYSLIYYADPYPGSNPGALIDTMTTDGSGNVSKSNNVELNRDLPSVGDANYPGAKIWLVPSSDYNGTDSLTAWNPSLYLFEINLIQYDDTGV